MPDLYDIAPTQKPTDAVRNAAVRYMATLSDQQLVRTMFPVDDPQWRKWMNQGYYVRDGVSMREMTAAQRSAALGLMRASLSARGYELTRNIMRLNETLAEMINNHLVDGEWGYYFTIMGKPSALEPWGWQFQGPHAIINYFVLAMRELNVPPDVNQLNHHYRHHRDRGTLRPTIAGMSMCVCWPPWFSSATRRTGFRSRPMSTRFTRFWKLSGADASHELRTPVTVHSHHRGSSAGTRAFGRRTQGDG